MGEVWEVGQVVVVAAIGFATCWALLRIRRRTASGPARPTNWQLRLRPGQGNPVVLLVVFAVWAVFMTTNEGGPKPRGAENLVQYGQAAIFVLLLLRERLGHVLLAALFAVAAGGYLLGVPSTGSDTVWLYCALVVTGTMDVIAGCPPRDPAEFLRREAPWAAVTVLGAALLPLVGPSDRTLLWNHQATARNVGIDVVVAAGVWLFAYSAHAFAYRTIERANRERKAVLDERARLARELHDVVAHDLSVVIIQSQAARLALPNDPDRASGDLVSIERASRDALSELRRLIGVLREDDAGEQLRPQPGVDSLDDLVRQMNDAGLDVDLSIEGSSSAVPAGASLSAYRIVQEALTNTRKHAGPVHAAVVMRVSDNALDIEINDDGRVAVPADVGGSGHGIVGMQERVSMFGGTLTAGPRDAGGWAVHAHVPFDGGDLP